MAENKNEPQGSDGAEAHDGASTGPGAQTTQAAGEGQQPKQQAGQPPLMVRAQYIKDLSFENPAAPQALAEMQGPPDVDVGVNVNAQRYGEDTFEVALSITGTAKHDDKTVFVVELVYAGVFSIGANVAQEHREPLILIECPRLLFPFARNIIADVSRDGGFPPLLLQPFDFVALYQQHLQQRQEQGGGQPAPDAGAGTSGTAEGNA